MPIVTKATTPTPPSNPAAIQDTAAAAKAAALKLMENAVIDDSTAPVEVGDKEPEKKVVEDPDAQVDDEPVPETKPDDEPKEDPPEEKKPEKKGLPDPLKNSFEKLAREKADMRKREEALKAAEGRLSKYETVERLAQIYLATVATLGPRIMVHGEPTLLARPENASRIRALLLAGVRAAVLWRQCGGSRLGLLLGRQRILRAARELL